MLKPKGQAHTPCPVYRSEAVFVVFLIEYILNGPVYPQGLLLVIKAKCVSGGEITPFIALETVDVRIKCRIAKDGCKIAGSREKVKI